MVTKKQKFEQRKENLKRKIFNGGALGEIEETLEDFMDYVEDEFNKFEDRLSTLENI
jgi:archaellum component FlaC